MEKLNQDDSIMDESELLFSNNWGSFETNIDVAESDDIIEQNHQELGHALNKIAGRLRYGGIITSQSVPDETYIHVDKADYLGKDYSDEVLNNSKIAPDIKHVYEELTKKYPILRRVEVVSGAGIEPGFLHSGADMGAKGNVDYAPHMVVEGDFTEKYEANSDLTEKQYEQIVASRLAMRVGCEVNDILQNERLKNQLVFLHEMGHAVRFQKYYLAPMMKLVAYESSGGELTDEECFDWAHASAAYEWSRRSILDNQTSLVPFSVVPPEEFHEEDAPDDINEYLNNLTSRIGERYASENLFSQEEVAREECRRYRARKEERFADDFAEQYFVDHFDEYFTHDEADESGKIVAGKEVDITEFFGDTLDLQPGRRVQVSVNGTFLDGFIFATPRSGEGFLLCENDDPENPGEVWDFGDIQQVLVSKVKSTTGVEHQKITIETNDGTFKILPSKSERAKHEAEVGEMVKRLNLYPGNEIQMLSMTLHEDDEEDEDLPYAGAILYGQILADIKDGEPICIGAKMYNDAEDEGLYEYATWPVTGVEREWGTWRIHTAQDGRKISYELIPLPENKQ